MSKKNTSKNTDNSGLRETDVSSSTLIVDDMKTFLDGADNEYLTKIYLTGDVSGQSKKVRILSSRLTEEQIINLKK